MRILRNLLFIVAIVIGIVLASANMTMVRFVYLPDLPFFKPGQTGEIEIQLALLLLLAIVGGAFIAGTGTFVEHVRLRFLVRRNAKVVRALRADLDKLRAQLEEAEAQLSARGSELASEQARVRRAEESEARALALAEEERARADRAAETIALPPVAEQ